MMKSHATLMEFTAQAMDDGFDEVVQKDWAPNLAVVKHTHPFDVRVKVTAGQVQLSFVSDTQTYTAGQSFYLERNLEHAEQYGPEGAHFWVARKL
jgi:quercetin dioxygenase-like cupin family protein